MKLTPEQLADLERRTRLRAYQLQAMMDVFELAGVTITVDQLERLANYGLHIVDFPQDIIRAARAAAARADAANPPTKERQCN